MKVYKISAKKVWRSYVSWHWRVIQNLKKNWFVNLKKTWLALCKIWGIWQIFIRALESLEIGTLMGSFFPKWKMHELKIYRGVMCHGKEEWCNIWRGIDLSFQNWFEEFDEFWPEDSRLSKICTLMGLVWTKYVMFELKRYKRVIFHGTEECILTQALQSPKNWHFDGLLLNKIYVWAKKAQRSYVSWNWRVIQDLKKKTDLWFGKWN